MAINQHRYGNLDPIPFKVTKNGSAVTGITFSANDVQSKIANDLTTGWGDISSEITEEGLGWYSWTPTTASQTSGKLILINIAEVSGTNFDENGLSVQTGGNSLARLNGV